MWSLILRTMQIKKWCKRFLRPCWQEVGPDVERLVVHLKAAEDTVQGRALRVAVPRDDAVLPEHLGNQTAPPDEQSGQTSKHLPG